MTKRDSKKQAAAGADRRRPRTGKRGRGGNGPAGPALIRRLRRGGGPPFAAEFFAEMLPTLVESCPCPEGHEVFVRIHLGDGDVLDTCQVVAVSDRYVVLATFEGKGEDGVERTMDDIGLEAVPYDLVIRASVRPGPKTPHSGRFGFARIIGRPHGVPAPAPGGAPEPVEGARPGAEPPGTASL